jgi:hypothetical protein
MTVLFYTCAAIMVTAGLIGAAFGSLIGGLVACAALCLGLIWEMGA